MRAKGHSRGGSREQRCGGGEPAVWGCLGRRNYTSVRAGEPVVRR